MESERSYSSIMVGSINKLDEEERLMDKKKQQQAYENYVKQKTPVHNL